MKIYHLEHVYVWLNEVDEEIDEVKYIGTFSTRENAIKVIEELKGLKGFKDHPVECFQIHEDTLDSYEWREGFSSLI